MTNMNTQATKNNTVKNVDFFKSTQALSARTSEFFRVVLKKAELQTIYKSKMDANNTSIAAIDDMLEDGTKLDINADELNKMRDKYIKLNEDLKAELDKLISEQATFEYTLNDKSFKKAIAKAESTDDVVTAIRAFFKAYNLDVTSTTFEDACITSIGKRVQVKRLVTSGGTKALVYDANNALKNMYAVGFEFMVQAGTIKPADIPSVLRDKYSKKPSKKSKKTDKKAA